MFLEMNACQRQKQYSNFNKKGRRELGEGATCYWRGNPGNIGNSGNILGVILEQGASPIWHKRVESRKMLILEQRVHSKKELAHWTVDVTVQLYAYWLSGQLRCNFWTAFILSDRVHICIWPVIINENAARGLIKLTGVEKMVSFDGVYLLLRCCIWWDPMGS